jgi:hypothetical protein
MKRRKTSGIVYLTSPRRFLRSTRSRFSNLHQRLFGEGSRSQSCQNSTSAPSSRQIRAGPNGTEISYNSCACGVAVVKPRVTVGAFAFLSAYHVRQSVRLLSKAPFIGGKGGNLCRIACGWPASGKAKDCQVDCPS